MRADTADLIETLIQSALNDPDNWDALRIQFRALVPDFHVPPPPPTAGATVISSAFRSLRLSWHLSTVPNADDPHGVLLNTIEESVRPDDDLAVREPAEFRDSAPRVWELPQATQNFRGSSMEPPSGGRPFGKDVSDGVEELPIAGRGKPNLHASALFRS